MMQGSAGQDLEGMPVGSIEETGSGTPAATLEAVLGLKGADRIITQKQKEKETM